MNLPNNFELLDCTLRDGGYYTNWDFKKDLLETYRSNIEKLPFDYIEIGYRNIPQKEYRGKFFYSPIGILNKWCSLNKKIVLMLDEINIPINQVENLISPCEGIVSMFRIAAKPSRIDEAIEMAKIIKKFGFKVCINLMYLSEWDNFKNIFIKLRGIEEFIDYLYMADSYGSILPDQIEKTIHRIRSYTAVKLGFHGHNNIEMGLINSIRAIENGVKLIDSSVSGMGRGAGNLKTELFLTYLDSLNLRKVNFEKLNALVSKFESLRNIYHWGSNLAYMVSGSNSIAQKEVMDLITRRYYSINNAIKYLGFKTEKKIKTSFKKLEQPKNLNSVLVLGGGPSVLNHKNAIISFLEQNDDVYLLFSSARHISHFNGFKKAYVVLIGSEGRRLENNMSLPFDKTCIVPKGPYKIAPYIPKGLEKKCRELSSSIFEKENSDSHLAVTLQTGIELGVKSIYLVGFDGYSPTELNEKGSFIMKENQLIFNHFMKSKPNISIESLTETTYKNITVASIYARIK